MKRCLCNKLWGSVKVHLLDVTYGVTGPVHFKPKWCVTFGLRRPPNIFNKSSKRKITTIFDNKHQNADFEGILFLHPPQSGASQDETLRELQLMHFTPFNTPFNTCKSQLHLSKFEKYCFYFANNCHGSSANVGTYSAINNPRRRQAAWPRPLRLYARISIAIKCWRLPVLSPPLY